MRTLPLHPHCSCVYDPYYRKVKGKRKPWKQAVKDTMSQFREYEQRQILATRAMLERFKAGEDIEKIFNTIRPKYPIKKYIDIFKGVDYNTFMRSASKEELEEFLEVDKNILKIIKDLNVGNFKELWISEKEYRKHILKRLKEKVIENEKDYIDKIKNCVLNPDGVYIKKYTREAKEKFDRWDRIYYKKNNMWVAIFNEKAKINTAYYITKDFNEILFKGDRNQFDILLIDIKELGNARKS